MFSTTTLVLAFALAVTVFGHPFRNCGLKVVTPANNYDNSEFSSQAWDVNFIPDYSGFKNVKAVEFAAGTLTNKGCSARNTITYVNYDNSKSSLNVEETYVGNAIIFENVLDNNNKASGETNIVTFYYYKTGCFAQYHICTHSYAGGQETAYNIDFRYVLVNKGYKLTPQDIQDIKDNDKKENFEGEIRELGLTRR